LTNRFDSDRETIETHQGAPFTAEDAHKRALSSGFVSPLPSPQKKIITPGPTTIVLRKTNSVTQLNQSGNTRSNSTSPRSKYKLWFFLSIRDVNQTEYN